MRRDSIFYKLFQQSPSLLFQLLQNPPANADDYRFDSVAVKEPRFEIDGVFLPPENENSGVVYFCEVQFQVDKQLYERVFAESSLYFYRNRARFSDWQAVIIYPSRKTEQSDIYPHRSLLNGEQVHRVYLDELGDFHQLPVWVALMVLTTVEEGQAPEAARYLLTKTNEEIPSPSSRAIIEMITTIMVYKFEKLSRTEVESMLGITLKETRVYREIKEEGREEGREEGLEQATVNLVIRLLTKRFGELSGEIRTTISALPLPVLEDLSEALLDFTNLADLQVWLTALQD
ncbi:Rpn family recombination-promoting nuclease/putative transposase [Dolichospermum sp. ST_sed1]|nr:Rpn family recombination-promoting nuclease/putative transposase [Dolichospermum sp. ST_sed1]MDD1426631.1 Rpn family recombination-promoting nuclease/putative transposase [Dolichospermum sp. ST_sed9]MDD1433195.1 Rpn family recombination-promoting nuclease/putative transposase [Dolichospermum sp. ST_sed6]MDD1435502.1 Rpn family recombination-promoting nuclease/putative transposase [Dolichospermum sp. ST_sed10]MDD1442558.1 Rpn family recombination-promoting nuclease/putative transposase [Dolic